MGQVSFHLNGRTYRFDCGDGEEARFQALGDTVKATFDKLGYESNRPGDDRLLVMLALMLADELLEARSIGAEPATDSVPAPRARKSNAN